MRTIQSYKVPAAAVSVSMVEKKSEFIASLGIAQTEGQALEFLESIRKEHRTATHNVYAYVLKEDAKSRYSDDGEPAKTAGLPVLSAIQHAQLLNCIIVVTRYFGGTLLGTGGLVRAYTSAASAAIEKAGVCVIRPVVDIHLRLEYSQYEQVTRVLNMAGAKLQGEPVFGGDVRMCARLPKEDVQALVKELCELLRGEERIEQSEAVYAAF